MSVGMVSPPSSATNDNSPLYENEEGIRTKWIINEWLYGHDVRKDWRKRARGTRKGKDVKSMEFELDRKRERVIKVNRRLIRGVGNNDNAIKEFSFG